MSVDFYTANAETVSDWIDGDGEFLTPTEILSDLSDEQATAAPSGSPHSIANILAHMHYFQVRSLAKRRGQTWPKAEHLDDTFVVPADSTWDTLRESFLADLSAIKELAAAEEKYGYASCAIHNAYHFGQIVLLRRELGLWPPAGGESYDY